MEEDDQNINDTKFLDLDKLEQNEKSFYVKNFSLKFQKLIPITKKYHLYYKYMSEKNIYIITVTLQNLKVKLQLKIFQSNCNFEEQFDHKGFDITFDKIFNISKFFQKYEYDNLSAIVLCNWINYCNSNDIQIPIKYRIKQIQYIIEKEHIYEDVYENSEEYKQDHQNNKDQEMEQQNSDKLCYFLQSQKQHQTKALNYYENVIDQKFDEFLSKGYPSFLIHKLQKKKPSSNFAVFIISLKELEGLKQVCIDDCIKVAKNENLNSQDYVKDKNSCENFAFLVVFHNQKKNIEQHLKKNNNYYEQYFKRLIKFNYYLPLQIEISIQNRSKSFFDFLQEFNTISVYQKEN